MTPRPPDLIPLPTITASAVAASSSVDWALIVTPFIEVTSASGQQIVTRQLGFLIRFKTPSAMKESSSLNPWKVRMAMCISALCTGRDFRDA